MKAASRIEWIDARGHDLPTLVVPITAQRGSIKLRLLGIRNVGTRTLHDLHLKSEYKGVNKTEFQYAGKDRWQFFPYLFFGCLAPEGVAMFWVKETFTGMEGSSSRIYVEEGL